MLRFHSDRFFRTGGVSGATVGSLFPFRNRFVSVESFIWDVRISVRGGFVFVLETKASEFGES